MYKNIQSGDHKLVLYEIHTRGMKSREMRIIRTLYDLFDHPVYRDVPI